VTENGYQKISDSLIDILKTFFDDESYNSGHGHTYEKYGVDPTEGAVAVIRPDQCKFYLPSIKSLFSFVGLTTMLDVSLVTSLDDHETIGNFFSGFALHPQHLDFQNRNSAH